MTTKLKQIPASNRFIDAFEFRCLRFQLVEYRISSNFIPYILLFSIRYVKKYDPRVKTNESCMKSFGSIARHADHIRRVTHN